MLNLLLGSTALAQNDQLECLALNMYFEARGETTVGKLAVAFTTLNRVASKRWPNTICGVVYQRKQFSWTHDGLSDVPANTSAWSEANYLASVAIELYKIKSANHYHNLTVFPKWAAKHIKSDYLGYTGNHIFYRK